MQQVRRLHAFSDMDALISAVAAALQATANACLQARNNFHCVLAGGETPRRLYRQLTTIETDWSRWHIYFGDERCVPTDDDENRNDRMAMAAWLEHVPVPTAQIHPIPAELGPEAGADAYAQTLSAIDRFDLVLLGLGEDGHTASLFPNTPADLRLRGTTLGIRNAPKPPAQRVSLSAQRLTCADRVWFLVGGESKRDALTRWLNGEDLPARMIAPPAGVDIYTDVTGL